MCKGKGRTRSSTASTGSFSKRAKTQKTENKQKETQLQLLFRLLRQQLAASTPKAGTEGFSLGKGGMDASTRDHPSGRGLCTHPDPNLPPVHLPTPPSTPTTPPPTPPQSPHSYSHTQATPQTNLEEENGGGTGCGPRRCRLCRGVLPVERRRLQHLEHPETSCLRGGNLQHRGKPPLVNAARRVRGRRGGGRGEDQGVRQGA